MNLSCLILSVLFLGSLPAGIAAEDGAAGSDPIKVSISASFARQVIEENDSVPVDLWISNNSDFQLINAEMHIAGPDFLEWHEKSCDGKTFSESTVFSSFEPHSLQRRRLCVKSTPLIKVGEFNILFTFKYQWNTDKGVATSFVSHEKTIKSNIFGSDSVAGIPLAFAGFVVPGLFFWFVIHLFRAPWNVGVALGDKLIYSILVSICIVAAGKWIRLIDISSGISVDKLIRLAFIGASLGLIVASADYILRLARRRRAAQSEIVLGEDEQTLLRKVFRLNPRVKPGKGIVRLKNGERYIGSLVSRTATTTSLIGWFKIDLEDQTAAVVKKMKVLEKRGQLLAIFDLAKRNGIDIQIDDAVQQQTGDEAENTGDGSRQWANDEVAGIIVEPDGNSRWPLRLTE